jgi:hypothetical protein
VGGLATGSNTLRLLAQDAGGNQTVVTRSVAWDGAPPGVKVVKVDGFNANQVARVLTVGGTFLTQQVHGLWAYDLLAAFDAKPQWPTSTLDKYVPRLKAAGLTMVNTQEWSGTLAFTDVGAIAYYLKAVPWLVPGFSVETHLSYLLKLQSRLENGEALAFVARKYLSEVCKAKLA